MKKNVLSILGAVLIIPLVIAAIKKKKAKRELRNRVLADGNSDYKGTANDIAQGISGKTKQLYRELITQVHPDRFVDDRKIIADELAQRITRAKHNYSQLAEIEKEVKNFLNN